MEPCVRQIRLCERRGAQAGRACSRRASCARCASVPSSRALASERPSVYLSST